MPRLGITLGDPAGVGPELVLRALAAPVWQGQLSAVVYGQAALLRRVAKSAQIPWPAELRVMAPHEPLPPPAAASATAPVLLDFPFAEAETVVPGRVHACCGRMAATWIEAAARDALAGRIDALVTAPINKEALHLAGVPHPGHTEMLAALTGAAQPATMLFWSPDLIVSLATIHVPLSAVPRLLTVDGLLATIRRTAQACARFGRGGRSIAVLALNPHAGEHGLFGREEEAVIAPAIAAAQQEGLSVVGPLVPDTAFSAEARNRYGAYVALYHDQGLIPFKMLAFANGVNVTLGLPLIRTSPDHGTAFDRAWQGTASATSLLSAIQCAALLAG